MMMTRLDFFANKIELQKTAKYQELATKRKSYRTRTPPYVNSIHGLISAKAVGGRLSPVSIINTILAQVITITNEANEFVRNLSDRVTSKCREQDFLTLRNCVAGTGKA